MKSAGISLSIDAPNDCIKHNIFPLLLPANMTIEAVEALAAEFKQLPLVEKSILALDASQVETITTPCLQLIISLEKTLSAQSGSITISNGRDAFNRAFEDAGLSSLIRQTS